MTAIPLLGIYPRKTKTLIWKDICILTFTAIFIYYQKPRYGNNLYPQINGWIKKMWHMGCVCMYTQAEWNTIQPQKRKSWHLEQNELKLEGIILSEISQRKTNTIWSHLHGNSLKQKKFIDTEKRSAPGECGDGWNERAQKIQTSSNKVNVTGT